MAINNINELEVHRYYYGRLRNGRFFQGKLCLKKGTKLLFKYKNIELECNYLDIAEIRKVNFQDYVFD